MAMNWQIRSGKPITEIETDEHTTYQWYEKINSENLAPFHRLDLSATYRFTISKKNKIKAKTGFSIRNLYNNINQLNSIFIGNNAIDDPVNEIKIYSIGFTPNFMLRIYW